MSSSIPGTLYRIYEGDKHYTAVQLKDGSVLEVKNPDTGKKTTFPSVEEWRVSHSATEVKSDTSKAEGIVLPKVDGFNFPPNIKNPSNCWFYWCYEMMAEGAPHLLQSEEVKTAYNEYRAVCDKYAKELHFRGFWHKAEKYSPHNLQYRPSYTNIYGKVVDDVWCGIQAYFQTQVYGGYSRYSTSMFTSEEQVKSARNEITCAYKKLYDLIQPSLVDFLTKKHTILSAQARVSNLKASLNRVQKKLAKIATMAEYAKKDYDNAVAQLAKIQSN